jgi:hypothetical protein
MRITQLFEAATVGGMSTASMATTTKGSKTMLKRQKPTDNALDSGKLFQETENEGVAGPKNCWPGHRKVGTKPGTGKNAGKRVNDCEKIKEEGVAEGKDDKIAQLKKDHETAVHWSKNEKSPQKREAARQKAEKIKRHLETQYKQGVAEGNNPEYDDEAGMADNNLETLKRAVEGLDNMISTGDNLPEWCQEKIAVAKSMLVSVWDYMQSEENSMSESTVKENKKGVRAVKHTVKPRNPVAKNAMATVGGGAAGAHKDKKKAAKQGEVKHKNKEPAYESKLWAELGRKIGN